MTKAKRKQLLEWATWAIDNEWSEHELKSVLLETIEFATTSRLRWLFENTYQEEATKENVFIPTN